MRWEKLLDLLAKVAYARRGWKNTECVFVDIATRDVARWDFDSDRNIARWLGGRHGVAVWDGRVRVCRLWVVHGVVEDCRDAEGREEVTN
jgi:hypothetical protein